MKDTRKMKGSILIVDDSKLMRVKLHQFLTDERYLVWQAENGIEALKILKKQRVDLVIADIHMPVMDGFALARKIRSDHQLARLPILVCSSTRKRSEIVTMAQIGIQGFFLKPISPSDVLQQVEQVFAGLRKADAETMKT